MPENDKRGNGFLGNDLRTIVEDDIFLGNKLGMADKILSLYQKEENTSHLSSSETREENTSHLSSSDLIRRSIKDEGDMNMMDTRVCALLRPSMTNEGMDTRVKPEYDEWGKDAKHQTFYFLKSISTHKHFTSTQKTQLKQLT